MTADQDETGRFQKRRRTNVSLTAEQKADQRNWRQRMDPAKLKFTDDLKFKYCEFLARTSHKAQAAASVGMTVAAVLHHRNIDPEFNAACEQAMADYADIVHALAWKLMNGVKKPIIGGPNKDQVVAEEIVHAIPLVAMEMRKVDPAYKERSEVDVNAKGAVLVAPAGMSPEDWVHQEQERNKTATDPRLRK